ncbi:MAG: helix-turn-helix domain-containing protein, partial [Rhodopila sp.]
GITPETLSRCMQTLRRNGTISFPSQRQIRILDREALVSISGSALDLAGGVFSHAADRLPAVA